MTSRRPATLAAALAVAGLLLAGAACSDDGDDEGGDRPTTAEVAAALPEDGLDEDARQCVAQAFVDSDISDDGLRAIVDAGGLTGADGLSAADVDAATQAGADAVTCAGSAAVDDLTTSTTAPGATTTAPG